MTDILLTLTGADAEAAAAELAAALDLRSLPRTTPGDAGVHAPEVPRKPTRRWWSPVSVSRCPFLAQCSRPWALPIGWASVPRRRR
ncbi:MAG: hypothetical protein N838_23930 [Thiohalocapsa sp. PB-PSB1]|jgi:hypothetical protein|nr:MAG: hypothetical protein N838_23930 [Thiohalocapsa sp. PB-PSB1]